jgi:transaldolase
MLAEHLKIFADTADVAQIKAAFQIPGVLGVTTNPSLAKKAGVSNYKEFIREVISIAGDKPASFEVISDEFDEMKRQALWIADQGQSVYVKIPITNTRGESSLPLVAELGKEGVCINLTAVFTIQQITAACEALSDTSPSILSIFCGRISDAGQRCKPIVRSAVHLAKGKPIEVLWASAREPYNIIQAQECGCHIVTLFPEFIKKMSLFGKDLNQFSLETVQMFYRDAVSSGFEL